MPNNIKPIRLERISYADRHYVAPVVVIPVAFLDEFLLAYIVESIHIDLIQHRNTDSEAASHLEIVIILVKKIIFFINKRPSYIRPGHKVYSNFLRH